MAQNNILVKVGNKSTSRFRNAKTYRAITVNELKRLANNVEASIIVVEFIRDYEYSSMIDFLREFNSSSDNHVFFYVPDNDDNTTGAADELSLDIYMSLTDLYRAIQMDCGIIVDPDLSLNKKEFGDIEDDDPFNSDFEDPFGDVIQASAAALSVADIRDIETLVITNKQDAGFDIPDEELGIESKVEEPIIEEIPETAAVEPEEIPEIADDGEVEVSDTKEIEVADTDDTDSKLEEAVGSSVVIEDVTKTPEYIQIKEKLDEVQEENKTTKTELLGVRRELGHIKQELSESRATNTMLETRVAEAIDKIKGLNKTVKAVKDERDAFKAELVALEESAIIEDPVVLDEYEKLKARAEELEANLSNASSKTSEEVEGLIAERDGLAAILDALKIEKVTLEDKIGELEIQNSSLESQLISAKDTSAKDEQIDELGNKVTELSGTIQNLTIQLNTVNSELNKRKADIERLTAEKAREISNREHILNLLQRAIIKLRSVEVLQNEVDTLRDENVNLYHQNELLQAELNDTRAKLTKTANDADVRVELARKFAQEDLENTKQFNLELHAKIEELQSQLSARETQYNSLVQVAGFDESGASSMVNNVRTLEAMNTNLRSQLSEMTLARDASEREKIEMRQSLGNLKEQNDKLTTQIRAMSSGYSGGAGTGVIPPILYSGRASIICVTGSGSYGITTTAYSAALNLANQGKTLFIDFDMISAKADSWFKMSPMVKTIPGINPNNPKSSGLGIFIDRGAQFFLGYAPQIIQRTIRTKGGSLDYLSGLYEKPDVVKLVAADFSQILNYCGNTYDYIVIDFGRLGASEINNQILKIFSDVSRCTVMVTSSDRVDIRNARIELQKARIDIAKMAWLVNLAESTKLDEQSRSRIMPAQMMQLPFISDFYGQKKDFSKDRMSKDKFKVFLEKCILRR